jgi:hypothetical protein
MIGVIARRNDVAISNNNPGHERHLIDDVIGEGVIE